ncbi:unnamed protein product [Notodromas monacha]|uniref:p53 DNA-binding domain-containing protein n=1 Tax=Notodromas monacha TaxID=399045 RepID=A0A7R9BNU3_9CRUS|nr:unnamed protein product [Notodromas monacha]CAG0917835.1 unnamed protein product [Notodromas monacha]
MKTQVMENRHNLANFILKSSEGCNAVEMMEPPDQVRGDVPLLNVGSQPSSVSSAPSSEDWPGKHNFTISFKEKGSQNGKIHSWLWSEELQKLFVEMNKPCPFDVKATNCSNEQLYVRALPLYTTATNVLRVVKRCPNHASSEDATNIDVNENLRHHLIRAECGSAVYEEDTESKRLSVRLPLGRPEPGANWTTLLYKFMCLGSCVGGINRRALQIIFTLETASGEVVGRQCIGVRICACPSRDRKVEERKLESSNGDFFSGIPANLHHLPPVSRKRSGSFNSHPNLNATSATQREFLCAKVKPKVENPALEDNVYMIKVHCYANYLLLKEIAFALEVKQHASEMYPTLIDEIVPMFGSSDNDRMNDDFPEKESACIRQTTSSSTPTSSNPPSGCVSPDSDIPPPFPTPQMQPMPNMGSKSLEVERNKLKRSMTHCASMLTRPQASAQVQNKRVCGLPEEGKGHEKENSSSKMPVSDGLYMLAEQADKIARDPPNMDLHSRCTSPEPGVRLRAFSMSATDKKYRERMLRVPAMRSCQVQTDTNGAVPHGQPYSQQSSPPPPLYVSRMKTCQIQPNHQQRTQVLCTGPPVASGSQGPSPVICNNTTTLKEFMESYGIGELWIKMFENRPKYHSWPVTAFACWSEEDFEFLGLEKRLAQFLVTKLANYKSASESLQNGT